MWWMDRCVRVGLGRVYMYSDDGGLVGAGGREKPWRARPWCRAIGRQPDSDRPITYTGIFFYFFESYPGNFAQ